MLKEQLNIRTRDNSIGEVNVVILTNFFFLEFLREHFNRLQL